MKKRYSFFFILCFLFIHAQNYTPRKLQTNLKIGLVNSALNVQLKLNAKTILSADGGVGLNYLHTNSYNKYNHNSTEYEIERDNFLNFGHAWYSFYTAVQLRRIFHFSAKDESSDVEIRNTYNYLALGLRLNAPELNSSNQYLEPIRKFKETYEYSAILGRQIELGKRKLTNLEFYGGLGLVNNYNFDHLEARLLLGIKFGLVLGKIDQ